METTIASRLPYDMPPELTLTDTDSAGTTVVWELRGMTRRNPQPGIIKAITHGNLKATRRRIAWASPEITPESVDSEQVFDAIQSLYLSNNRTRDRQIAARIIALYRDALAEDERILSASLRQFTKFFL